MESCNNLDDLFTNKCVNVNGFNTLTEINEANTLTKHISCDFRY